MVDIPINQTPEGESSKIKNLIGRKPGLLKSKFLTVLGNSNELLNRISNKLEITLSLSSSDSDYCDDDDEEEQPEETVDFSTIDFDARRVKARRAHEEIISGRFRHPNLIPKMTQNKNSQSGDKPNDIESSNSSSINNSRRSSSYSNNSIDSKSPNHGDTDIDDDYDDDGDGDNVNGINETYDNCVTNRCYKPPINLATTQSQNENSKKIMHSNNQIMNSVKAAINCVTTITSSGNKQQQQQKCDPIPLTSKSSTLTSLNDPAIPVSVSIESSDIRNWMRSESENSEASWASSISLDNHQHNNDEIQIKEFMKKFVDIIFSNSSEICLELKSEFGEKARHECGRLWFSRFVNSQRTKSKRTDETTFYSLVQYFAIILFECAETEDYSPAKNLMNMCFTFYHEIEVPGCEPYREYLFTYLRQQPIWHTLRFWNAAFFDALRCVRVHRPVPKLNSSNLRLTTTPPPDEIESHDNEKPLTESDHDDGNESVSSSSEHHENAMICNELNEDTQFQQNITFGQLGTFTCNMHAFGLSKDLCLEFLRKQSTIANLPRDQEQLLRDNINRMYHETDKWGA